METTEAFEIEEKDEDKKVWYIHQLDKAGQRVRIVAAFYVYKMAEKTLRALNKDRKESEQTVDEFLDKYDKLLRQLSDY